MKRNLLFFASISLLLFFSACVTPGFKTQKANAKLANQYLTTGQQLEKQGDLPAALEQYKLALTVDPKNSSARSNQERLSKKLSKLANERYNLGMKYYSQLANKQLVEEVPQPLSEAVLGVRFLHGGNGDAADIVRYVFH